MSESSLAYIADDDTGTRRLVDAGVRRMIAAGVACTEHTA